MSDRQIFDRSSVAPRGRYEGRINLERAGVQPGGVSFGNDMPLGTMRGGRFEATRGMEGLGAARSVGMTSAPVAMSMKSWRSAAKAGLIHKGAVGGEFDNYSRRQEILNYGASANIALVVDMTDMWRLAKGFNGIAVAIKQGHSIIAKAINDGLRVLKTGTRRKLVAWTGIRSYAETERGMRLTYATAATMTGALRVTDRHRRIGKNFGAAWSRANPGGTHAAWNRPQMAAGSFMGPSGILFKRVGRARKPIAPLWGPNMAREIQRHSGEIQADVVAVARTRVISTAVRLMSMAIAKGGK